MKLDDMYEPNRRGEAAREGGKQPGEGVHVSRGAAFDRLPLRVTGDRQ